MIEINHENIELIMTAFTASNDLSIIKVNITWLMLERGYILTNLTKDQLNRINPYSKSISIHDNGWN